MVMFGRRGIPRPPDEEAPNVYHRRFTRVFSRLRQEVGTRSFPAHNKTVTACNVDQIAGVVRACHDAGFGMFSFQPAAFVGDERRQRDGELAGDRVWEPDRTRRGHPPAVPRFAAR